MDKKDIKLIEEQFWDNKPDSHFKTFEEVENQLKDRKQANVDKIPIERETLIFEGCYYKSTHPLKIYSKESARDIYNQVSFLAIVSPSTFYDILTIGIYNANKSGQIEILKNALHTYNRLNFGKRISSEGAYNHSGDFDIIIDAFADCDLELVKKYLPEQFGLADKNTHPFFRVACNLMMSMMYKNEAWLKESLGLALKYNALKGSNKYDVLVVKYLIALAEQDTALASELIQEIANVYKKTSWLFNFRNPFLKFFGVYVHGLYYVAHFVLPKEKFELIRVPNHTVFWTAFDEFTKNNGFSKGHLSMNFTQNISALKILFDKADSSI